MAARFSEPGIMRLLAKHGADPLFVHHSDEVASRGFKHKTEVTTALMAATGMGGSATPWVQPARREREALALEATKLTVELGVDVNAVNTDGRTALDAAKAQHYDTVAKFLVDKGAKSNSPGKRREEASGADNADNNSNNNNN
jgi:ankyrin repeat protein